MKNMYVFSFNLAALLLVSLTVSCQDTLRTYGPRFGVDLARIVYIFTDPPQTGAEVSLDMEVYENIYPVLETGYSSTSSGGEQFDYRSAGYYFRLGGDYNLLPVKDRSIHHSLTVGFRYGLSLFEQRAENITIPNDYWGEYHLDIYRNQLKGNWLELVGGVKTELVPNFFLGWSVRYKILLNPEMDDRVTPLLVPGYGNGTNDRGFAITYSILYQIPLWKK